MKVRKPWSNMPEPVQRGVRAAAFSGALLLLAGGLTGCGTGLSQRGVIDAGAATAGGFVANKLTKGNTIATVAAAAGSGIVADAIQGQYETLQTKRVQQSYDQGRSDATKQLYWAAQSLQSANAEGRPEPASYYEVRLPEQQVDGVVYKATSKVIRINE